MSQRMKSEARSVQMKAEMQLISSQQNAARLKEKLDEEMK